LWTSNQEITRELAGIESLDEQFEQARMVTSNSNNNPRRSPRFRQREEDLVHGEIATR